MRKIILLLLAVLPVIILATNLNFSISTADLVYDNAKHSFNFDKNSTWTLTKTTGSYQLPGKTVNIILPAGATVSHTDFSLSGTNLISASQPVINPPYSDGKRILTSTVASKAASPVTYLGVKQWGDVRFASFCILPATYNPVTSQYSLISNISISLDYTTAPRGVATKQTVPQTFKPDSSFLNADALAHWYTQPQMRTYDYLIISTPALYDAAASLIAFRQNQGMVTQFADINTILTTYPGSNGAQKVRNYLISEYSTSPFTYLLLIGDINLVPIAYLMPEPNGFEAVPSDFYYSDLTSNFDSDNDGNLGEYNSGMDFTPEVYVGRIPWNQTSAVSQICSRIVSYETSTAAWKNKVLLPAAFLNYENENNNAGWEQTDGATVMEYLKSNVLGDYDVSTLYEQEGVVPSYPSDYPLTESNFTNLINNESWGLVNWSAHGSSLTSARKVWLQDFSNDGIPDAEEMQWFGLVSTSTYDNVMNTDGSVYFCASCYNGMIDEQVPSLGEYLLMQKAVADISATRTGWYKIGWANPGWGGLTSYNYHFMENYAGFKMTVGAAHGWANWLHTQYCLFGDSVDTGGIIWPELQNVYTYLLYGDPAIGYTPQAVNTAGQILIWEPTGSTGNNLLNGLHEVAPYNVIYTDKLIDDYSYLSNFDAVFCLLGFGDESYWLMPNSFEYAALLDYATNGGKLYMEGYVNWDSNDPLTGRFGAVAPFDHLAMIEQISMGIDPNLQIWEYNGWNNGAPALALAGDTSSQLFRSHNTLYSNDIIGIWNRMGDSRTIASSFQIGGVTSDLLPYDEFLAIVLDTLGVSNDPVVGNDDQTASPALTDIRLFPNPFRQNLTVSLKTTSSAEVKIYNVKGQLVCTSRLLPEGGKVQWQWNGMGKNNTPVTAGIYLMHIRQGGLNRSFKLLKL